mgnify:FL=1
MIYLIGYMGSGKSYLGKLISNELKIPYLDTDKEIEKIEGKSIIEIFNEKGEKYFRRVEQKILHQINNKDSIISCGGGLPIFDNNMNYINNTGTSIYLKGSYNHLYSILKNKKKRRPLIAKIPEKKLLNYIKKDISEREKIYKRAKYTINIENRNILEILRDINTLITNTPI